MAKTIFNNLNKDLIIIVCENYSNITNDINIINECRFEKHLMILM